MKASQTYLSGLLTAIAALAFLLLTSCTNMKKIVHKEEVKENTRTQTETATTRTITEQVDSNVTLNPDSLEGAISLQELFDGPETFENENTTVTLKFDSVSKKINTKVVNKPKVIPVHINKTTVESENKKQDEHKKIDTVKKDVDKDRQGIVKPFNLNYLWWLLLLLLIPIWKWRKMLFS
jgi:hypothetical protein